ncbi:hypothetical protein PHIM7_14 [Sinorhizobium phage phiM7]|uniref:Uncharacterized protein n=2 Tax=Emdodecavirus TaxID=1980937 RepID=S5M6H8_9CAUD|nr:hypothetical protein AB690_gp018 [Sinorhizobium phage phiM12]YP_009601139.1 hypothetical protein FDH46_gp014 [Sinorhizobium phage phiM7]AGR47656.1 hypothetical protein SmphiM12_024 [Sinorhizobium phage phiM12]AKF12562.1 hypothetical protein PHIM7_14 [Sinorhizobium phage phiM7]AKF12922.1 hypothetical protein PHIM19_15 [Sinorhizobium phage phiM19]
MKVSYIESILAMASEGMTPEQIAEQLYVDECDSLADGEYICQLQPKEVKGWIARAEQFDKNEAENAEYFLFRRVMNALEYLEIRSKRIENIEAKKQLELF